MNTHFEIIKELLKVAQTTNNREETKRLTTYIDNMHSKCIDKRIESCTAPCTLQKTKRGNFCIYNPGDIEVIPNEVLSNISSQSKLFKNCGYIFARILPRGYGIYGWYERQYEPDLYRERFRRTLSQIYMPYEVFSDTQLNDFFDTLKEIFETTYDFAEIPVTKVLKRDPSQRWGAYEDTTDDSDFEYERPVPLRNEIKLDIDTADGWYRGISGKSTKDRESLKNEIIGAIRSWATRFNFTVLSEQQEEHYRYGELIAVKVCKTFNNFKATNKLALLV